MNSSKENSKQISKENHREISSGNKLVFAINPTLGLEQNAQAVSITRLETYFKKALDLPVEMVIRHNYQETLDGMERGEVDVAQLGPYAFALAQTRFGASALVNTVEIASLDEKDTLAPYRSVIFTRSDSGITGLGQLKGQSFGFVDRNSTTGYLVATFLLQQAGLDPATEVKAAFLNSHRAVAEAVFQGELAAGATMEAEFTRQNLPLHQPPLRLLAASPLISKGPVVVRPGLPPTLERKLLAALVRLSTEEPDASRLLLPPTQRFAPAVQRELTLKSIAELAGVSYGTVSRAINGRDRIAPATTARVLKLVEELGYRPNGNARSLHKTRGELVGLALPGLSYPGLDAIIAGLQAELDEAQLQLLLYPLGQGSQPARLSAYFELLYDGRLEGTLLTQHSMREPELLKLIRSGKPTALLEQDLLETGLATLADWLKGQGYRHLKLIRGMNSLLEPAITLHTLKRLDKLSCEISEPGQLARSDFQTEKPVAIFCLDDETGLLLQNELQGHSQNPLLIGLGESLAKHQAKLPYLAFDGYALGQAAARRLLTRLNLLPANASGPALKFWVQTP